MDIKEALGVISDGHSVITAKRAKETCKALGVEYSKKLEQKFYSDTTGDPKGLRMAPGQEGSIGVYTLTLSGFVASSLGVADKARSCIGRGFQAQAYATEVEKVVLKEAKNG